MEKEERFIKNVKIMIALFTAVMLLIGVYYFALAAKTPPKSGGNIIVNGELVPAYYILDDDGEVMVPLTAVTEKLGIKTDWSEDEESAIIGGNFQIWADQSAFTHGVDFGEFYPTPQMRDDCLYVPLLFFKYIIRGYDVYISEGIAYIEENHNKAVWFDIVSAFFSDDSPEDYSGKSIDSLTFRAGKTADGGDIFAFLRSPLGTEYFAGEITEARLFLKSASAQIPEKILVAALNGRWNPNDTDVTKRADAKAVVDYNSLTAAEVRREEGGWISVSIAGFVRAWLNDNIRNAGLALFGIEGEPEGVFFSEMTGNIKESPYIEVYGSAGERGKYGKFAYTPQPAEGLLYANGGNCLAYAIRDNNPVFFDSLGLSYNEVNRINIELGDAGVVEYVAELFEKYVDKYKEELYISNLRRIDDFDSEIDPSKEYRIALRAGCGLNDGDIITAEDNNFDFHFWAQTEDGRWSQKFTALYSNLIPYLSPGFSPGKYPWDTYDLWFSEKARDFNRSKVIYFAVTKDTDVFTNHRELPFIDIDAKNWLYTAGVEYVINNGLMPPAGSGQMMFGSNLPVSLGVVIEALYRMDYSPKTARYENTFEDAFKWAAANGITYGFNEFYPDDYITREQLAVILFNYERFTGKIPPDIYFEREFEDADKISGYAAEAVQKIYRQRLLRVGTDNLFYPKNEITRIDFAVMLFEFNEAVR